MSLKDHQKEMAQAIHHHKQAGKNKLICQSPTGTGKGYLQAYICEKVQERNGRVMFMVSGRNVIKAFSDELNSDAGVKHTLMMSGEDYCTNEKIVVASADTLHSWFFKEGGKFDKNSIILPDYLLVDECRKCCTPIQRDIINFFADRGVNVIGFDATPIAKGLHLTFDEMFHGKPTPWHIQQGNLCPVEHYSPSTKDETFIANLKEVKKSAGDYNLKQLGETMNKTVLVGEIVDNYEKISMIEYGEYKSFVVSCVDSKHAASVYEAFLTKGHNVELMDKDTAQKERDRMIAGIREGKIQGIISMLVLSYGININNLHIAINARPSKSIALFLQFGGRVLRTHEDKTHAVYIDHSAAIREHGYLDDVYSWSIDPEIPMQNETRKERESKELKESVDITCKNCGHAYKNAPKCPRCNHENIINLDEPNVVYLNTDLVKRELAARKEEAQKLSDMEWLSNMKALVYNSPSLKSDAQRFNTLQHICSYKFKRGFDSQVLNSLPAGNSADETAKNYWTYYNMRRNLRYKKR